MTSSILRKLLVAGAAAKDAAKSADTAAKPDAMAPAKK